MSKNNSGKSAAHGREGPSSLERMSAVAFPVPSGAGFTARELAEESGRSITQTRLRCNRLVAQGTWTREAGRRMGASGPYNASVYREVEK